MAFLGTTIMPNMRSRLSAGLRDVLSGLMTKSSLDEYLTLLSVAETCEYQGLDFLDFLRSEETDVDTFARGRRRHRGLRKSSLR
jgi:hypothetical protein